MKRTKPRKDGRVYCSEGCPPIEVINDFDELAYLSGLMDAEGTFCMTGLGAPSVRASNNNPALLQCLKDYFGGEFWPNHRGESQWAIQRMADVDRVCGILIPKLITKKRQAELIQKSCRISRKERLSIGAEVSILNEKKSKLIPPPDTVAMKVETSKIGSEWSYFGGILDGDGTIVLQDQEWKDTKYHYPQFHVYSIKPAPLLWLQERFGGQFESRKRGENSWISSLSFEDQVYVEKMLVALRPHVREKRDIIDLVLEACQRPTTDRIGYSEKVSKINERFCGKHKFTKNADGTYIDGKRSSKKPHKTHKGKLLAPIITVCETQPEEEFEINEEFYEEEFFG